MEIIEESADFVLTCTIPGAERDDIRVDVSPHRVVIVALPRTGAAAAKSTCPYDDFERAVPLAREVRPAEATARFNNGTLEVILPKKVPGGWGVYKLPAQ